MAYIFLDESGDLGFDFTKSRTSKFFIITVLFANNKRPVEKVVKDIHRGLRKKYRMKSGVLHPAREEEITNSRFCKRLSVKAIKLMTICLNKSRVHTRLQDEKSVLYNYVANILLDRIMSRKLIEIKSTIELIASRRETNKFLNENFKNYLNQQIRSNHKVNLEVKIKTPHEEKSLQAVDVASWAIFRKYEYGDSKFYDLLKPIILEESPLFP